MHELAKHLAAVRKRSSLSLRAVEASTGISNAYLSQLENGKIQEPSPNLLHKLAELYREDYRKLLELAGYPVPSTTSGVNSQLAARLGNTTKEEENALVEYLDFLRSRRKAGNRR
ncbi:MAG TPA: helix-turn-helix transcriptional regulator [Verrucomicrobiae bacterium]|nr:helix-turn-helix transcriptional regulator [Verrucomicrobiae bacterium]